MLPRVFKTGAATSLASSLFILSMYVCITYSLFLTALFLWPLRACARFFLFVICFSFSAKQTTTRLTFFRLMLQFLENNIKLTTREDCCCCCCCWPARCSC